MSEVVRGSITREEYLLRYYSRARVRVRVRRFASLENLGADCAEKCLESLEADGAERCPRIPCAPNASADDPACVRAHTHTLACAREKKNTKKFNDTHMLLHLESGITLSSCKKIDLLLLDVRKDKTVFKRPCTGSASKTIVLNCRSLPFRLRRRMWSRVFTWDKFNSLVLIDPVGHHLSANCISELNVFIPTMAYICILTMCVHTHTHLHGGFEYVEQAKFKREICAIWTPYRNHGYCKVFKLRGNLQYVFSEFVFRIRSCFGFNKTVVFF
jgi:hypothetical protein